MFYMQKYFILFFLLSLVAGQRLNLSIIISAHKSQVQLLSGCLYSVTFAINEYASKNDELFTAEILVVPIGTEWDDSSLDTLLFLIENTPVNNNQFISSVQLLDIERINFATSINHAVSKSSGDILLFLTHNIRMDVYFLDPLLKSLGNKPDQEIIDNLEQIYSNISEELETNGENSDSFDSLIKIHPPIVGMSGGRQLFDDGKLFDTGIDFYPHKIVWSSVSKDELNKKQTKNWRNNLISVVTNNYCTKDHELIDYQTGHLPVLRWQGEHKDFSQTKYPSNNLPSGTFLIMYKSIYNLFGGLDESYQHHKYENHMSLSFIDLGIFLKHLNFLIKFEPTSVGYITKNEEFDSDFTENDKKLFTVKWNTVLKNNFEKNYKVSDLHLVFRMECGITGTLGTTIESINLLSALEPFVPLSAGTSDTKRCLRQLGESGLPRYLIQMLDRLFNRVPDEGRDVVFLISKDPNRFQSEINRSLGNLSPVYYIGRSSHESDAIPESWINSIDKYVDEIWVPSEFNIHSFTKGGIHESKIKRIGNPINTDSFDPNLSPSIFRAKAEIFNRENSDGDEKLELDDDKFTFLTVTKFDVRKGWKELLSAFYEAFDENEPVQLIFRTYIPHYQEKEFKSYIHEAGKKIDSKGPPVFFIKDLVSYSKLRELYSLADAYISTSYGDGWITPCMEAMSMELPTLGVNWGGTIDFMNAENSYLFDYQLTEKDPHTHQLWAIPDKNSIIKQMRFVYENYQEAKLIGKKAREDIINYWGTNKVGERMADMLQDISKDKLNYIKIQELRSMIQLGKQPENKQKEFEEHFKEDEKVYYKMNRK